MNKLSDKALLVVVAKAPVPGRVKTRFLPELTLEEAADLYRCFIHDRINEISTLDGIDKAIAFTPAHARETFATFTPKGFKLFAQKGKDLGERLINIFLENLTCGYDAVSIIDSDSPDLHKSVVLESFRILLSNRSDVVFGPCQDGGYYLVGMRKPHPELFKDIPWSTETVLRATLEKAKKIGIKTELLSSWNDLDTFQDLIAFYEKYKDQKSSKNRAGENTLSFLTHLERINRYFADLPR
jgi:rSAM/selenodomain-associated transferase 1